MLYFDTEDAALKNKDELGQIRDGVLVKHLKPLPRSKLFSCIDIMFFRDLHLTAFQLYLTQCHLLQQFKM